ncbi:hypothetical protein EMCRGX_G007664 [Ephydatia muelleri]
MPKLSDREDLVDFWNSDFQHNCYFINSVYWAPRGPKGEETGPIPASNGAEKQGRWHHQEIPSALGPGRVPDKSPQELHLMLYMQHLIRFMRCDELVKLKCADVIFNAEGMGVKIESSKTDQYRDGASVVIAHTGHVTCPVGMMEHYFCMGEVDHSSQSKLFQWIE